VVCRNVYIINRTHFVRDDAIRIYPDRHLVFSQIKKKEKLQLHKTNQIDKWAIFYKYFDNKL